MSRHTVITNNKGVIIPLIKIETKIVTNVCPEIGVNQTSEFFCFFRFRVFYPFCPIILYSECKKTCNTYV